MAVILGNRTRAARVAEWRAQSRLRASLGKSFAAKMTAELRRAGNEAAEGFEAGRQQGLDLALGAHSARLRELLAAEHRRALLLFGERVLDAVKDAGLVLETKDARSLFSLSVERWIATIGAQKVVQIGATTKRQIVAAIAAGEADGDGIAALGKRIRDKTSGTIGRARALVIARTEVHTASQVAAEQAQDALDLPAKREWIAAQDLRTRDSHVDANGQIRGHRKPFDVGGEALDRPGDPKGSPGNVINCRCITVLVFDDDQ